MRTYEVMEHVEKAHEQQQKHIGLTTAIIAVILAFATMLANDANTRKIVDETKTADWWAYSAFHDTNARIYMADERLAQAQGQTQAAQELRSLYDEQDGYAVATCNPWRVGGTFPGSLHRVVFRSPSQRIKALLETLVREHDDRCRAHHYALDALMSKRPREKGLLYPLTSSGGAAETPGQYYSVRPDSLATRLRVS